MKRKIKLILTTLILVLCFICSFNVYGLDKIKVGCFPLNNYYNIDNGNVSGYGAEYFEQLAEINHWDYEYVTYDSWDDALDGLRNSEIDLLSPAQHTEERDKEFLFGSFSVGTEYGALLTKNDSNIIYEDYEAFDGLTVGVVSTLVFLDEFEEYQKLNSFHVNYKYYDNTTLLMNGLNKGEVSAVLCNLMAKTDSTRLLARFGVAPYYYIMNINDRQMQSNLNYAIDKLNSQNPSLEENLKNKYFPDMNMTPISKEELNYINSRTTINVACDKDSKPFSYEDDNGDIIGLDKIFLDKISSMTGLSFKLYSTPYENKEVFYQEKQIDLIAGVEYSIELSRKRYTDSYFTVNKCFVGNKDTDYTKDDFTVAVISSSENQIAKWKMLYPNYSFINYNTIEEGFNACQNNDVDMILENRYTVLSYLESPRYQMFTILQMQTLNEAVCYELVEVEGAIDSILLSILNKTISKIDQDERDTLLASAVAGYTYTYTIADFFYQYRNVIILSLIFITIIVIGVVLFIINLSHSKKLLKENEMKLSRITNNINGGVVVLKPNKGLDIIYANDGFLELIGFTREEFEQANNKYLAYVANDDLEKIQKAVDLNDNEISLKLNVMKKDNTYFPALFNGTFGIKSNGERELYCVIMDMSIQEKLFDKLQIENARTKLILDRVNEIFYEINIVDKTINTSNSFEKRLGWNLPKQVNELDEESFKKMWNLSSDDKIKLYNSFNSLMLEKEVVTTIVKIYSAHDNKYMFSEILQYPILNDKKEISSVIGLIRNIDKEVSEREMLIQQTKLDSLTGLLNKEAFMEEVTDFLKNNQTQTSYLLFIDLDHFKDVNDTLGHLIGDKAIVDAANKLKGMFLNINLLSRFGGDEFCIFIKEMNLNSLMEKMSFVIKQLEADYTNDAKHIHITCSCGISSTRISGYNYKQLMTDADKALYNSKKQGRNTYSVYDNK